MSAQNKPAQIQLSPLAAQIAARAKPPVSLVQMRPALQPETIQPASIPQNEIAEWYDGLSQAVSAHRNSLVEIAYYGYRIRQSGQWEAIGFEGEDHCRQHLGISEKTWNQYLGLGERLIHLSLKEMQLLTLEGARLLTRVHPRIWDEYAWAEEAALLPAREFAMLVDQRNRDANPAALAEPKSRLAVEVSLSQLPQMERRIDTLKKQHQLSSSAATLSYALSAAERERSLTIKLDSLEHQVNEMARIWRSDAPWSASLREDQSERTERILDGSPIGLTDAAIVSQRIMKRILKSMEEIHAVLPETPEATTGNSAIIDGRSEIR